MPDEITIAVHFQANLLVARRLVNLIDTEKILMALELKGLKAEALAARAHHARLLAAYRGFNVAAPAHAAEVEGLAEEITEMQSDLAFAVGLGGNGGGSAEPSEQSVPENAPAATAANPEAIPASPNPGS